METFKDPIIHIMFQYNSIKIKETVCEKALKWRYKK